MSLAGFASDAPVPHKRSDAGDRIMSTKGFTLALGAVALFMVTLPLAAQEGRNPPEVAALPDTTANVDHAKSAKQSGRARLPRAVGRPGDQELRRPEREQLGLLQAGDDPGLRPAEQRRAVTERSRYMRIAVDVRRVGRQPLACALIAVVYVRHVSAC